MYRLYRTTVIVWLCLLNFASAATMDQLRKIDSNRNNALDAGAEFRAFRSLEKLDGSVPLTPSQEAYIGGLQADLASMGAIPFANLAKEEEKEASACERLEGVYLRHDKLDMSIIRENIKAAKGASISYTDNREDDTQTAEIQAVAAAVLARNPCVGRPAGLERGRPYVSGYSFAVSVEANGKLTNDRATEKSALKPGIDAQLEIDEGPLFDQLFTVSPYYQTDFRGIAQAYGFSASWEPFNYTWRLGGSYRWFSPLIDFFYQLKAEAVGLRVNDAGLTDLTSDTDYFWLGGTARLNVFILPELLHDRLTWIGTYKGYFDERANRSIRLYTAELAYNITEDGLTSISVEYQNGTERDTLEKLNQYLVTLNVKY
jgi:hypothetical protein